MECRVNAKTASVDYRRHVLERVDARPMMRIGRASTLSIDRDGAIDS